MLSIFQTSQLNKWDIVKKCCPYKAGSFLLATSAEHAVTEFVANLLHIFHAVVLPVDENLKWYIGKIMSTLSGLCHVQKKQGRRRKTNLDLFQPFRVKVSIGGSFSPPWQDLHDHSIENMQVQKKMLSNGDRFVGSMNWLNHEIISNLLWIGCDIWSFKERADSENVKCTMFLPPPATIPSNPAKSCPWRGRQTGGNANKSTCSTKQKYLSFTVQIIELS